MLVSAEGKAADEAAAISPLGSVRALFLGLLIECKLPSESLSSFSLLDDASELKIKSVRKRKSENFFIERNTLCN